MRETNLNADNFNNPKGIMAQSPRLARSDYLGSSFYDPFGIDDEDEARPLAGPSLRGQTCCVQPRLGGVKKLDCAPMDNWIADGLIQYLMLIALLTFHEFGHAWTAMKCGDDTAKLQGRVSLNPIVHIDPIGTVLMPLLMIFLPYGVSRFLIGGAKPVPVNPYNLRHPNRDDLLVTLAGPGMNLLLAILILGIARFVAMFASDGVVDLLVQMAHLSLLLCFFNLLVPIPPLDGSHVVRVLIGMSHENYAKLAQFGFIPVILVWQIPAVQAFVQGTTDVVFNLIALWAGFR
jgi:Zn-dependent protease